MQRTNLLQDQDADGSVLYSLVNVLHPSCPSEMHK